MDRIDAVAALEVCRQYVLQTDLDSDILQDLCDSIHEAVLQSIEQQTDRLSSDDNLINLNDYKE